MYESLFENSHVDHLSLITLGERKVESNRFYSYVIKIGQFGIWNSRIWNRFYEFQFINHKAGKP